MRQETSHSVCRECGATSYRRLTHRDLNGAMTYSGTYRCSGCSLTFTDPATWRGGPPVSDAGRLGRGRAPGGGNAAS
jgi:hypothetical protein